MGSETPTEAAIPPLWPSCSDNVPGSRKTPQLGQLKPSMAGRHSDLARNPGQILVARRRFGPDLKQGPVLSTGWPILATTRPAFPRERVEHRFQITSLFPRYRTYF